MATTVITSKYRSDLTKLFVDDVAENDYFIFISDTANTEALIPTAPEVFNHQQSKNQFLEKTLFGKRVDSDEVVYMIRNRPWVINTVYTQYDDMEDISDKNYYAVIYPENNIGDYRVYKCLFNNYGSQSIYPPNFSVNQPDQIYPLSDGYVWKFMYSISVLDFDKYNARGYIPIIQEASANNETYSETFTVESSINQIFVENPDSNRGYEKVSGFIQEVNSDDGSIRIVATRSVMDPANTEAILEIESSANFNRIENYYSGYTFYVTLGNDSKVYKVDSYKFDVVTGSAEITLFEGIPGDDVLQKESTFFLLPRIEIRGDGEGALAIPTVSDQGTITDVKVLNSGFGYTNARAFVPDPFAFDPTSLNSLDERVILRPIISPRGGHGSNIIEELSCRHALVYTNLTETDNQIIPTTNQFSIVGIVKNPEFKVEPAPSLFDNRIAIEFVEHSLQQNEIVTQIETSNAASDFFNDVRFRGKVHEVSGNTVFLCEYMGPFPNDVDDSLELYANTDFSDISLRIDLPIISSQNQVLSINTENGGFAISPYVQRTGEVYYMNRLFPILRTEDSREQFKILLEF